MGKKLDQSAMTHDISYSIEVLEKILQAEQKCAEKLKQDPESQPKKVRVYL
jgi:hypothetical protein